MQNQFSCARVQINFQNQFNFCVDKSIMDGGCSEKESREQRVRVKSEECK
jgi:hypothetical protein